MSTPNRASRTPFLRIVMVAFAVLTCIRVWMGPVAVLPEAQAQIPDSGMQRKLLLEEIRRTNLLLGEIKDLMQKQTFNVRVEGADNPSTDNVTRTR